MQNAVDEAMILFKGRASLKQYMPTKPVKRGFKVWVTADSLNGYICQYVGKEGEKVEVGLGQKVVEELIYVWKFSHHEHRCASSVGAPPLGTQALQVLAGYITHY